ncbi:hypothetical protein AAC387_Pa08g1927 [Persea americana]
MVASEVPSSCQSFSFVHLNIKDGFINGINRDKGWVKGASNWVIGKVNHLKNLWLKSKLDSKPKILKFYSFVKWCLAQSSLMNAEPIGEVEVQHQSQRCGQAVNYDVPHRPS